MISWTEIIRGLVKAIKEQQEGTARLRSELEALKK